MYNKDFQQFINLYMKEYGNLYPIRNIYPYQNVHMSEIEINTKIGFINLLIISGSEQNPLPDAAITVFVNQGENEIPIMYLYSAFNPILLPLPVAYSKDPYTLIKGPEYYFSSYSLKVDAIGFYSTRILNIRMFEGVTTDFNISMIPVAQGEDELIREEIINIPPHPRDIVE